MAGADSAGDSHGRDRTDSAGRAGSGAHPTMDFLRANPQVLVLLVICVVLGLGTFLAVLFGLFTAGSGNTTGEPSGAVSGVHALVLAAVAFVL